MTFPLLHTLSQMAVFHWARLDPSSRVHTMLFGTGSGTELYGSNSLHAIMKNEHLWCYTPQSLLITSIYSLSCASLHALSASPSDTQKTIPHHIRQFIMTPFTPKADVWFVFCLLACRYICNSRPLRSHDEVSQSLNPPLIFFSLIAFFG